MAEVRRNRLKVLRAERDLSQEQLAERAGVARERLNRIEREHVRATPDERDRFVEVLNEVGAERKLRKIGARALQLQVDPRGATRGARPRTADATA